MSSRTFRVALILLSAVIPKWAPAATVSDLADAWLKAKQGEAAVVLLQFRSVIDGKASPALGLSHDQSRLYLARLDDRQAPQAISPVNSPSQEAAAQGWVYLSLSPGVYFLLILPPGLNQNPPTVAFHADSAKFGRISYGLGRGSWDMFLRTIIMRGPRPADFRELSGFWFTVPEKTPLIYAGTVSVSCTTGRGLFGSLIGECSDLSIASSKEEANRLAQSAFPAAGPVHESKLARYGRISASIQRGEKLAILLSALPAGVLEPAKFTGMQARPIGLIHGAGQAGGVFNVLAIATEALSQFAAQEQAGRASGDTQPCVDRLSAQLSKIDFNETLASAFSAAVRERNVPLTIRTAGASGTGEQSTYSLTPSPVRIGLRECTQPGQFCLELAMRLSLRNAVSNELAYDSMLLYASSFSPQNPFVQKSRLYERLVDGQAQCRLLNEWCAPGGMALLQNEIMSGMRMIAERFVVDLEDR